MSVDGMEATHRMVNAKKADNNKRNVVGSSWLQKSNCRDFAEDRITGTLTSSYFVNYVLF